MFLYRFKSIIAIFIYGNIFLQESKYLKKDYYVLVCFRFGGVVKELTSIRD